ncbi:glycoside hydrolase family 92 protein [Chitinophaga horti]|uniref:Glycoside hydrolase family 92 protein n=1 Tax=Chitinophaga horti TaxID=2920382 RepID=A0ABY6J465_9BACT|nr:GH92 family glycosyl hydrolase [Chitinophaga horti]UYQ94470.1 glycoside hydrolase family 92 protein [Chitinophaga horti]
MMIRLKLTALCLMVLSLPIRAQEKPRTSQVNVFLGTSGDHGQLSPAASYPFSMLSIVPQTYPAIHTGYEYTAKQFLGFAHTCFEGVGCRGSGGNILVRPFVGASDSGKLHKLAQAGSPGAYSVTFTNKISAAFTVYGKAGLHHYQFPAGPKGFTIDLSHTLANDFVAEQHNAQGNSIKGWVEAKTTCNAGKYKLYYSLEFSVPVTVTSTGDHTLKVIPVEAANDIMLRVALSSVSEARAQEALSTLTFNTTHQRAAEGWEQLLGRISVKGDKEREALFYSMLYRTLQSPYDVSEPDGQYRATDGSLQKTSGKRYNGWAIWDNYRTQLPLLSLMYPDKYADMANSIAEMYLRGKKDYATQTEPSNTVRTEHAMVVLLDALRKGYRIDIAAIREQLIKEADGLDFGTPDKALEASYDTWALAEILAMNGDKELAARYMNKALNYKNIWNKDFRDITKNDVDRMQARGLYQGTIWQYRWFVPFDVKGLIGLTGGEETFVKQLDHFFDNDLYNHANEPDLQAPLMYNATGQPWKSQQLMHAYAVDTVIQYYFNDNSKGIDPFVDRIYKNTPQSYIRTMDDDAGAMSAWFVFAACGIHPACVGWPVYYLNVPLFPEVKLQWPGKKPLLITTNNFSDKNVYIAKVELNGKVLSRNYLTQEEIVKGGTLVITASAQPVKTQATERWVSEVK